MTDRTDIRHRSDGSIDTAFYLSRGRQMRSQAAHDLMGAGARSAQRAAPPRRGFFSFLF